MPETLDFISDLARQTGEMLIDHFCKADFDETVKIDNSLVTEADLAADRMLQGAIRVKFPNEYKSGAYFRYHNKSVYPAHCEECHQLSLKFFFLTLEITIYVF